MRRAARVDGNHKEVMGHFRSLGFMVHDISQLKNCADLVVSGYGRTLYVEVKDGSKPPSARRLTGGELLFMEQVLRHNPDGYVIVESLEDVNNLYKKFALDNK
jgi:hypothetical protein